MVNQYSWNLDAPQDYLQHDKLGAHYSKNWNKQKQDEYNKWYYQTHKEALRKKRAEYGMDPETRKNRLMYENMLDRTADRLEKKSRKTSDKDAAIDAAIGADHRRMESLRVWEQADDNMKSFLNDVNKDKDKFSNKVRFDANRTAKKVSNAVKNIGSSIGKVANQTIASFKKR